MVDEINNKADKQLGKSIKSFKTNHDDEYNLRKRMSKKGFEIIWKQLKSGHWRDTQHSLERNSAQRSGSR